MSPKSSSAFWRGKKVLLTAGPTRELIDPVRFLTNASSGKFGVAIADAAHARGASVTVVLGPCEVKPVKGVRVVPVTTALQMRAEVLGLLARADIVIASAAVGDWRVLNPKKQKIKRKPGLFRLTLVPNPDIIKEAARRRGKGARPILVGFALETKNESGSARRKLADKGLDLIVANGPASLGSARVRFSILTRHGAARAFPSMSKVSAAAAILKAVEAFAKEDDARRAS